MNTKPIFSSTPPKPSSAAVSGCVAAAVVLLGRLLLLAVILVAVTFSLMGAAGGMGHELSFGHTLLAVTSLWVLVSFAAGSKK